MFGTKIQYLAPGVAILISGKRQAKDDFIDGKACSVGETPVLADTQLDVFKRPATQVFYPQSHVFFVKRSSKWLKH